MSCSWRLHGAAAVTSRCSDSHRFGRKSRYTNVWLGISVKETFQRKPSFILQPNGHLWRHALQFKMCHFRFNSGDRNTSIICGSDGEWLNLDVCQGKITVRCTFLNVIYVYMFIQVWKANSFPFALTVHFRSELYVYDKLIFATDFHREHLSSVDASHAWVAERAHDSGWLWRHGALWRRLHIFTWCVWVQSDVWWPSSMERHYSRLPG